MIGRICHGEAANRDPVLSRDVEAVRLTGDRHRRTRSSSESDWGIREPRRRDGDTLRIGACCNLHGLTGDDIRGGGTDCAKRLCCRPRTGIRAGRVRAVDVDSCSRRLWGRCGADEVGVEHGSLRARRIVLRGRGAADGIDSQTAARHVDAQVHEVLGTEGRVRIGRRPGTVDAEPSAARCDVRDAVDRLKTFVIVRVPVEIQDVLRVPISESIQDRRETRVAGVEAGGVGRPVAVCDYVADARVGLGCSHDRIDCALPTAPGIAPVGLRIRDEPDPARIEPAPIFTAATSRRCA